MLNFIFDLVIIVLAIVAVLCIWHVTLFLVKREKAVDITEVDIPAIRDMDVVSGYPAEFKPEFVGPQTFEFTDMYLRLMKPGCYSDTWYQESRKAFSAWAAGQWQLIAEFRKEMGLAT